MNLKSSQIKRSSQSGHGDGEAGEGWGGGLGTTNERDIGTVNRDVISVHHSVNIQSLILITENGPRRRRGWRRN